MMIQTFRYEPQGQRQRFEPREQQRGEQQEQDRHIHLHLHLNLTLRARQGRSTHPNAIRLTRIFAALLAATVMPLWIFLFVLLIVEGPPPTPLENLVQVSSCVSVLAGLALAWCAVGALLLGIWRARPRGRFGFVLPLLLLLLIPIAAACLWFGAFGAIPFPLIQLGNFLFFVVLIAHPLITALLLMWVSREARALRQQAPTYSKLGFVVVGGMVLTLLGGLLLNLSLMQGDPPVFLQLFLPAMCAAVLIALSMLLAAMVTLWASFRHRQPPASQPRPKDASPFEVASSGEPRGYRD